MLELSGKDFQVTMEKCFNKQLQVCLKQMKKSCSQKKSAKKYKMKNQMEILELKKYNNWNK